MSLSIRLVPETVKELAFGSIGAGYAGVGTVFDKPIRLIIFQNLTDVSVMISFDGVDDHIPLVTSGYLVLDITANKTIANGLYIAEGSRIYVKQLAGAAGSGSFYVSAFGGAS